MNRRAFFATFVALAGVSRLTARQPFTFCQECYEYRMSRIRDGYWIGIGIKPVRHSLPPLCPCYKASYKAMQAKVREIGRLTDKLTYLPRS